MPKKRMSASGHSGNSRGSVTPRVWTMETGIRGATVASLHGWPRGMSMAEATDTPPVVIVHFDSLDDGQRFIERERRGYCVALYNLYQHNDEVTAELCYRFRIDLTDIPPAERPSWSQVKSLVGRACGFRA